MKCFNGIQANGQLVPCGQCMNCRINKGRLWSGRILMEQLTQPHRAWFVTLTFSDENCPVTPDYVPTLHKQNFQNWIKNTYRDVGPFRYYAVGEYGDDTLRPHMHMAIFPSDDRQIALIADRWQQGFSSFYELNPQRARYLANYTTKKLTNRNDSRLEPGQEPEFRLSSKRPALGYAVVDAIVSRYKTGSGAAILKERGDVERSIRIDGRMYPIAPYLLGKIREQLGIPKLHRDRLCHPGYYDYHQIEEAESCRTTFTGEELKRHAEKRRQQLNQTISV